MMNLLKELSVRAKKCTGCGACYNICPKQAIRMEPNPQGFLYPHVQDGCIDCGLCETVCPKLHPQHDNAIEPDCYAARANDEIRMNSSSGGMFTVFAEWIFDQGGIVCGAAMEKDYSVHHVCISDRSELYRLQKSKYVQSNTEHVFQEVVEHLKSGRYVLFTGTPCQVAAMRNFAKVRKVDAEKLYCVDILCHGVPSVQMWQDYVKENFDLDQVETIEFRSKLNGWRSEQLRVFWKDSSSTVVPLPESAYNEGFQRSICLRDGCEECEFGGYQRQGDCSMGDFWRVGEYDPKLDDKKGTSVVLVNNKKGEFLLEQIKSQLFHIQKTPIQAASRNRLRTTFHSHPSKARFKTLYPGHTFSTAVMQCRHTLFDIGQVAFYCCRNFGGQLTQYALYRTLTEMGYSVLMIERPLDSRVKPKPKPYLFQKCPYPKYAMSRYFPNIAEMKFLNKQCRTFVLGSDQMLNNNSYNACAKFMTMNFVTDNNRKIAYAASWGHDHIWGEESDRAEEAYYLQKYDYFSVREDVAVALAKREFGVDAEWVLDPIFLCPMSEYERMARLGKKTVPNKPYLFAYILDPSKEKEDCLRAFADPRGLAICAQSDAKTGNKQLPWGIDTILGGSIEEWISLISHSDFVLTDSFHGMCLAILFHKQFLVIVNKLRGEPRFTSLLRLLNLESRMVYSQQQLEEKLSNLEEIDYTEPDKILDAERDRCRKWLCNAIENDKERRKPYSGFDILDGRCDELARQNAELRDQLQRVTAEVERMTGKSLTPKVSLGYRLRRKIKGGIQCYKDHGFKYTWNRLLKKIRKSLRK